MSRFAVFAGDDYDRMGGWGDLKGAYDELADAVERAKKIRSYGDEHEDDWSQVVDLDSLEVIDSFPTQQEIDERHKAWYRTGRWPAMLSSAGGDVELRR